MIFIEVGNSSAKAFKVLKSKYSEVFKAETGKYDNLRLQMNRIPDDEIVVLSSVRQDVSDVILESSDRLRIKRITQENLGAVLLDYKTPGTLGIDRVLACLGAVLHAGRKDVIVIDSGTACTIDYMTGELEFKGGVILPGLPVQRLAMRSILPELPEVEPVIPGSFPGRSTKESIQWGVYGGYFQTIGVFIEKYRQQYSTASIYTAGGDGQLLSDVFKKQHGLEVIFRKELVLDGMRAWVVMKRGDGERNFETE